MESGAQRAHRARARGPTAGGQGLQQQGGGPRARRADDTVKIHLKNVFSKLGVADRTEAVTVAIARGLIHLD
jgi:DNA-binding NarL/FixJ family response regulator